MTTFWNGPIVTTPDTLTAAAELLDTYVQTWGNSQLRMSYQVGEVKVTITGRAFSTGRNGQAFYAHPGKMHPNNPAVKTVYRLDDIAFTGKGSRAISIVEQEKAIRDLLGE